MTERLKIVDLQNNYLKLHERSIIKNLRKYVKFLLMIMFEKCHNLGFHRLVIPTMINIY